MQKFKAWRYKCDFCGKNGRSAGHMRNHESGCTANPERICKIHQYADIRLENPGPLPVSELISTLRAHWHDEDHGVGALREAAEDCPCCMLAAIRQSGACRGVIDEEGYADPWIGTALFNFKEELARLWDGVNQKGEYAA